jgi:hypothetical protein
VREGPKACGCPRNSTESNSQQKFCTLSQGECGVSHDGSPRFVGEIRKPLGKFIAMRKGQPAHLHVEEVLFDSRINGALRLPTALIGA